MAPSDTLLSPDHANIVAYVAISVVLGVAALALIAFGVVCVVCAGRDDNNVIRRALDNLNGRRNGRSPPDPSIAMVPMSSANRNGRYRCQVCMKAYDDERDLAFHTQKRHPEAPVPRRQVTKAASVDTGLPFECGFCAKGFLTSHDLSLHVDTMHGSTTKRASNENDKPDSVVNDNDDDYDPAPGAYDRVPDENGFDSARF